MRARTFSIVSLTWRQPESHLPASCTLLNEATFLVRYADKASVCSSVCKQAALRMGMTAWRTSRKGMWLAARSKHAGASSKHSHGMNDVTKSGRMVWGHSNAKETGSSSGDPVHTE